MSARVAEYIDAIEHLPEGATLIFQQVSWSDYERLLQDLMGRHRLRVAYDRGRVEIMSTLSEHEGYSRFIERVVGAFADHFEINLEMFGQTTWKRESLQRGLEPDGCYYIQNAAVVIGKRNLNLESDPPPDIALEIDITDESLSRFPIYAALKVPEIWRYDGRHVYFYELSGRSYRKNSESRMLPGLKPEMLTEALEQSKIEGQTAALRSIRRTFT